jgi:nicotinate-nucleotide adenylyltransferase
MIREYNKLVFFGSFNPTHFGHLVQVDCFFRYNTEVDIIISPHNPHKDPKDLLPFNLRKEILEISITDYFSDIEKDDPKTNSERVYRNRICVNDIENKLPKPNYTYLTLRELTKQYGEKPVIALGTDVINNLSKWKNYEEILEYQIIECKRPGYNLENKEPNIIDSIESVVDLSSTEIRNLMESGDASKILELKLMSPNAFKLYNRFYNLKSLL